MRLEPGSDSLGSHERELPVNNVDEAGVGQVGKEVVLGAPICPVARHA